MAALGPLNVYICAHVLLGLAAALLGAVRAVSTRLQRPLAYRHQLRLGQAMAVAGLLLPLLGAVSGRPSFLPQTAQVWSAPAASEAHAVITGQRALVSIGSAERSIPLDVVSRALLVAFVAGVLVALVRLAKDAAATARVIAQAQKIRCYRSARVLASDRIGVPFSFWLPARRYVVVPSVLVLRPGDLRLALRHEAQHHRQHDTKLLYVQQLLAAAFFWNPAVHRLDRQVRELQEFSCDEALGGAPSVSARAYCECLLRVAEAATVERRAPLQTSMIGGGGTLLRRRVEAVLARPYAYQGRWFVWAMAAAVFTLMATTALAFTSTIHDRRISAGEARRMAVLAEGSSFPIPVNDSVLRELNVLLSTPDGRAYLQASRARMRAYEAVLSERLIRGGVPLELLGVPLVESGYRNLPQGADPRHGAGLWMFIAATARRFGLTVDVSHDDRLDVAAETDAAVRLFSSLHREFNDWGLALLAFNAGSVRVERAIAETGSRDVWALIARGHENDAGYVPRVLAAILILQNPNVLD